MKVIELLTKIANGELEDTKFKYDDDYFIYFKKPNKIDRYTDKTFSTVEFYNDKIYTPESLNDEVEIIEEKLKPLEDLNLTKIDINEEGQVYGVTKKEIILDIQTIQHWVNKTIDAINEMREDK